MMNIEYKKSPVEIIKMRSSRRTYKKETLEAEIYEEILQACSVVDEGLFGEQITFTLIDKDATPIDGQKLGDYGVFKNPRYFILGTTGCSDFAPVSYGYRLETLVLKANELGLGTCWIGMFNHDYFPEIELSQDEMIPAICVLGYADDRRLIEKTMRVAVRASKRKDWHELFFDGVSGIPLAQKEAGDFAEALEMLRLAPSAGNTQPWRVVKESGKDVFHFYLKPKNQLYYQRKLHHVDMGIAMCHFDVALQAGHIYGKWIIEPVHQDDMEYIATWIKNS